jgi:hypothetical protein
MKTLLAIACTLGVLLCSVADGARAEGTAPVVRNHRGKAGQHGSPQGGVRVYRSCSYGTSGCAPRPLR